MDALENENLDYQGEVNDNVGQDEGGQAKESGSDCNLKLSIFNQKKINFMLKIKT